MMTAASGSMVDPPTTAVAVIIVTHNSAAVLADCLAALAAALSGVPSFRVVVVDNASTDASVQVVAGTTPGATMLPMGRNAGYAAAINAGIRESESSEAFLILNPDVRLHPGSVAPLVEALKEPGTGIAVPRILGPAGGFEPSLRREPTVLRVLGEAVLGGSRAGRVSRFGEMITDPARYRGPCTADWATGAVMLVSRTCAEIVGPWDESFFLYSEETDFALRARDEGLALRYVPDAVAVHLGGESATNPELWALLTRNRTKLYRKRHGMVRAAPFWLAIVLNETVRSLRPDSTHRAALRALLPLGTPSFAAAEAPGYVCFSAQDWWYHNRGHSDAQLMRRVAETRRVLLVNSITLRMPLPGRSPMALKRIRRKAASMAKLVRRPLPDLPNFHVMTPVILPFYGISWARGINAWMVKQQVTLVSRLIGIRNPICVVTIPTAWEVVRRMPFRSLILNRSDRYSTFTEANEAFVAGLEDALLCNADRVVYASRALLEAESDRTEGRAYFLDHGVDLDHFRRRPAEDEPGDLAAIAHPRIGFFGGLDDYIIDFDLIDRLARDNPDAQVVLIGDATCSMQRFDDVPNLHWLGGRPYEEIPSYGSGFDVALMPWVDNEWIRHCNPIKLKEYLALGLPVVTTDFPEAHHWARWLDIATNQDDFIAKVQSAIAANAEHEGAAAARRAAVAGSSWEQIAARLIELSESTSPAATLGEAPAASCAAS